MTRQKQCDLASHVFSPLRYYLADNDGQHMDIIFILSKESNNLCHGIITGTWKKATIVVLRSTHAPTQTKTKTTDNNDDDDKKTV